MTRGLLIAAGVVVLGSVALSSIGVRVLGFDWAREWRIENRWLITKSDFGAGRYLHFLALSYLSWAAAGEGGRRLVAARDGALALAVAVVTKVGQQSLAVFVTSMVLARLAGMALDAAGRSAGTTTLANVGGWALLVATAYGVAWFKSAPWRGR